MSDGKRADPPFYLSSGTYFVPVFSQKRIKALPDYPHAAERGEGLFIMINKSKGELN